MRKKASEIYHKLLKDEQAISDIDVYNEDVSRIDLSVDFNHSLRNGMWITVHGNFTYATAKYRVYEDVDNTLTPWLSRLGQPISQRWGYIAERLFVDDHEVQNSPTQTFGEYMGGDIKYRDINNDGIISALDQVPIGYPTELGA